jgi:hypothetical protein
MGRIWAGGSRDSSVSTRPPATTTTWNNSAARFWFSPPTPSIGDGRGLFFPTTHLHEFVHDVEDAVLFDAVHDSSVVTCAVQQERV